MTQMIKTTDAINLLHMALATTRDQNRRGIILEALYDYGENVSVLPPGWTREQELKALIMALRHLTKDEWRLVVEESERK